MIEDRNLKEGTRLVGRYKKADYFLTVVKDESEPGKVRYRLDDGREFKSLSAAGSAVMQGHACNGWRFWSLMPEQTEGTTADVESTSKAKGKTKRDGESNLSEANAEEDQVE